MPNEDKYDLSVTIKGNNIFFELSTFNAGHSSDDELGLDALRIEMTTARIFHKLINYISEDKELFAKDDFKLLGEILGKIIFRGKIAQLILGFHLRQEKDPPDHLRIYLEFDNNPRLADLPWEYIQIWPTEKFEGLGEQSVYLSANEKNRFQLIRRLNKQKLPVINTRSLNVILIICNGANNKEGILSRSSESIEKVFAGLKVKHGDKFNFITLNNPALENFATELTSALKQLKGDSNIVPPYCVHYFGHSRLKRGTGELVFKTKTLEATWITDEDFAEYFGKGFLTRKCNENSTDSDEDADIRVDVPCSVLFQACDSGRVGDLESGKGVALAMAKKNIPAVIGMQNEIDPQSSSLFSKEYYKCLLAGGDVAEAVTEGRFFLGAEYNVSSGKDMYGNNEFGSPVLFINTSEPITPLPVLLINTFEQVTPLTVSIPQAETEVSNMPRRKCPYCGSENDAKARFCQDCGKPLTVKTDREGTMDDHRTRNERAFTANTIVDAEADLNAARGTATVRSSSGAANKK